MTTEETQAAEKYWIHQAQASQDVKSDVALKKDEDGDTRLYGLQTLSVETIVHFTYLGV